VRSFLAFEGFTGGVFVSAGDVNGDGHADLLVVAVQGGNGHVKVFDGQSGALLASFLSFVGATGEVQGTVADLDGDGRAEVVAASGGQVRVFNLDGSERFRFNPYGAGYLGTLALAAGDLDGDGRDEVFTAAANGHVKGFGADQTERCSFLPYPGYSGGVRVAGRDVNGDGRDDVLTMPLDSAHLKAFSGPDLALLDSYFASQGNGGVYLG
jgi:FG-GAP-like repeat/FG-GAP repeat